MPPSQRDHAWRELLRAANDTGDGTIESVAYYRSIVKNQNRIIVPLHPNDFHLLSTQCLVCKKFLNGNSMLRHNDCQPYPPPALAAAVQAARAAAAAQPYESGSSEDEEDPPPDPEMLKKYNKVKKQQKNLHVGSEPFVFLSYKDWLAAQHG